MCLTTWRTLTSNSRRFKDRNPSEIQHSASRSFLLPFFFTRLPLLSVYLSFMDLKTKSPGHKEQKRTNSGRSLLMKAQKYISCSRRPQDLFGKQANGWANESTHHRRMDRQRGREIDRSSDRLVNRQ